MEQGDLLKVDWSGADIIYVSSVCFPEELLKGILDRFELLKSKTRIISLKEFPKREFVELYAVIKVKMTWGLQYVYFYNKI